MRHSFEVVWCVALYEGSWSPKKDLLRRTGHPTDRLLHCDDLLVFRAGDLILVEVDLVAVAVHTPRWHRLFEELLTSFIWLLQRLLRIITPLPHAYHFTRSICHQTLEGEWVQRGGGEGADTVHFDAVDRWVWPTYLAIAQFDAGVFLSGAVIVSARWDTRSFRRHYWLIISPLGRLGLHRAILFLSSRIWRLTLRATKQQATNRRFALVRRLDPWSD